MTEMITNRPLYLSDKYVNFIASFFALSLVLTAIILEHYMHLKSCPLCPVQRVFFIIIGIGFFISIFLTHFKLSYIISNIFNMLFSMIGLSVALRQIYLQFSPEPTVTCSASVGYIIQQLPLLESIEFILSGAGNCHEIQMVFLGLSIPMWGALFFLMLGITSIYLLLTTRKS